MKRHSVTVRVPRAWAGRVSSAQVERWIGEYFRNPQPLPEDPGAGEGYLRLSLGKRALRALAAATDEEPSSALRRLIRSRIGLPAGRIVMPLPSPPAAERVGTELVRRAQVLPAEPYKQSSVPAVRVASSATLTPTPTPALCPACGDWTPHDYFGSRWLCTVCEARNQAFYSRIRKVGREPSWGVGHSGRSGWSWWDVLDVLIVAGVIALVVWMLRRLLRAAPAVAKPVAVPVQGGFMVWLPKQ